MLRSAKIFSALAALLACAAALAQTPAGAPAGATGLCKDGSYWTGATKKGACHGHKGVQDWYAAPPATPTTAASTVAAPAVVPAAPPAASKPATIPEATQAPGGGAGQVWVNTSSKVYHCPSDRWYGKTKKGAYMSEADAIAKGNRADHGKACPK
jgi:hypothetical protein